MTPTCRRSISPTLPALTCPAGTYNVVNDDPVTKSQNAKALAAAAGVTPWITGPGRLALLLGDRTTSMTRSLRVSTHTFARPQDGRLAIEVCEKAIEPWRPLPVADDRQVQCRP